jgi:uroporphyrinogen decarboxylase
MPEYRAIRAKHSMLEVIQTPELACQVTMQPVTTFQPDAAIIFADILTPLIGMGLKLDFIAGEGPRIFNPLSSHQDIEALIVPPAEENAGYTLKAITMTARELEGHQTPLIGFSGAPFTLAAYAVEDQISDGLQKLKALMHKEPKSWELLQRKLTKMVSEYLIAQAHAGAAALQIFDSWVGILSPADFRRSVLPWVKEVVATVRAAVDVPIIYFGTNTAGLFPSYREIGAAVYGADWRIELTDAADRIGGNPVMQGNLDPNLLFTDWPTIERAASAIIEQGRNLRGHIFNLGHGILPGTPVEHVAKLFSYVRSRTA